MNVLVGSFPKLFEESDPKIADQGQNISRKKRKSKQVLSTSTCFVIPLVKWREDFPASSKIKVVSAQSLCTRHVDVIFVLLKINVGHIKNAGLYTAKFPFHTRKR